MHHLDVLAQDSHPVVWVLEHGHIAWVEVEADVKEPEAVEPAEEPVEVVEAEVVIEEPKPVDAGASAMVLMYNLSQIPRNIIHSLIIGFLIR